jgi:hypothetical protein
MLPNESSTARLEIVGKACNSEMPAQRIPNNKSKPFPETGEKWLQP